MANPLLFLAPLNGSLAFQDRAGGGTLTGSGAVRYAPASGARTNLCRNPLTGNSVSIWAVAAGCTLEASTAWAQVGSHSGKITVTSVGSSTGINLPSSGATMTRMTPGLSYTVSFYAYNPGASDRSVGVLFRAFDLAGTNKGNLSVKSYTTVPAGSMVRIERTGTCPAGAEGGYVVIYADNAGPSPFANGDILYVNGVLIEQASSAGAYFDGATGGVWLDPLTGILGTAHASPSVSQAAAWVEEGTTNLLLNPSAETNTSDASGRSGATVTRDTAYAYAGGASFKTVTPGVAANEGFQLQTNNALGLTGSSLPYTGQCRVRGSGAVAVLLQAVYTDSSSTLGTATNVALTDTWQLVVPASITIDAAKTVDYFRLIVWTTSVAALTYYVDVAQVEQKAYATSYTDGSLGTGYAWTGTAHASASTRAAASVMFTNTSRISPLVGAIAARFSLAYNAGSSAQYLFQTGTFGTLDYLAFAVDGPTDRLTASTRNGLAATSSAQQAGALAVATTYLGYCDWDGVAVRTATDTNNLTVASRAGGVAGAFNVATAALGSSQSPASHLDGSLGPLAIFDRPLTDAERTRLNSLAVWTWPMLADRVAEVIRIGAGSPNAPGVLTLGGG